MNCGICCGAVNPLPAFAVLLGAFRSLSGANQEPLNYQVGQPATLSNDPLLWPSRYDLITPDAKLRGVSAARACCLWGS